MVLLFVQHNCLACLLSVLLHSKQLIFANLCTRSPVVGELYMRRSKAAATTTAERAMNLPWNDHELTMKCNP